MKPFRWALRAVLAVCLPAGLAAQVTPEARQVFERFAEALGGETALAGLRDLKLIGQMELPAAGLKMPMTAYQQAPNRLRVESWLSPEIKAVQVYDGEQGWISDPLQGLRQMGPQMLRQTAREADLAFFLNLADYFASAEVVAEGAPAGQVMVLAKAPEGDAQTLFFDPGTGLLNTWERTYFMDEMGQLPVEVTFADYRPVGTLLMPFRTELKNPAFHMLMTYETVVLNPGLEDGLFTKPAP